MKKIQSPIIISSIRSKVDGSLGFSASTPELSPEEKVAFFNLQNINLNALFEPTDFQAEDIQEVKAELDEKTPSQRLRNVIYVYWQQQGAKGEFRTFYERQMERLIDKVKLLLDPQ